MNGQGFYISANDNVNVFFAPTAVYFPDGTNIMTSNYTNYTYPINGWTWYENEDLARAAMSLPSVEQIEANANIQGNNISF
jgi:hypothetical protein